MVPESRRVRVEARPSPFELDLARAAVLVVDMQNDFAAEGGMLDRAGLDLAPVRRAIPPTARVLAAARAAGLPVVYLKTAYKPDLSDLGPADAPTRERHALLNVGAHVVAPDGRESRILVRDTWNTDVVEELTPAPGDVVMHKPRWSGFYGTALHATLQRMAVLRLVVVGFATGVAVDSTIRDAMFRDYSVLLLEDCTAEPVGNGFSRASREATLRNVESHLGWVSDSGALLRALAAEPVPTVA